jgi:hypothetical protein
MGEPSGICGVQVALAMSHQRPAPHCESSLQPLLDVPPLPLLLLVPTVVLLPPPELLAAPLPLLELLTEVLLPLLLVLLATLLLLLMVLLAELLLPLTLLLASLLLLLVELLLVPTLLLELTLGPQTPELLQMPLRQTVVALPWVQLPSPLA